MMSGYKDCSGLDLPKQHDFQVAEVYIKSEFEPDKEKDAVSEEASVLRMSDISNTTPEVSLKTSPVNQTLLCVLCFRECSLEQVVTFSISDEHPLCLNTIRCQTKLENTLGIYLDLDKCVICRTCWKLVEMVEVFKESILKASNWATRHAGGINYDDKTDVWLCTETLEKINQVHCSIQAHVKRMSKRKPVLRKKSSGTATRKSRGKSKATVKEKIEEMEHGEFAECSQQDNNDDGDFLQEDKASIQIETCEKCSRRFDTKVGLWVHMKRCHAGQKSKEAPYNCTICSATFTEPRLLRFHMNKHNGVKPFKCRKTCKKEFFSGTTRIAHERTCGSELKICPLCGVQLKTIYNHMVTVHGVATIACEICGRMVKSKKELTCHMRVHSDERKYPCNVCGKAFKSPFAAKVHLRIHTNEKPYACTICGQAYAYKVLMKTHIERIHGIPSG